MKLITFPSERFCLKETLPPIPFSLKTTSFICELIETSLQSQPTYKMQRAREPAHRVGATSSRANRPLVFYPPHRATLMNIILRH